MADALENEYPSMANECRKGRRTVGPMWIARFITLLCLFLHAEFLRAFHASEGDETGSMENYARSRREWGKNPDSLIFSRKPAAVHSPSTSTHSTISTAEFSGNSFAPTASRVCFPASPKMSVNSVEAGFSTRG